MSDLPIPFDLAQIRRQAKELRALALAGDRVARERIRRTHPRFGRGRLADADLVGFALRDAQLCLARELGFDGWREVLSYMQGNVDVGRPWRRWPDEPTLAISRRAERVSREAGHRHTRSRARPRRTRAVDEKTLASEVLDEFGITWELWIARRKLEGAEECGRRFNPAWYRLFNRVVLVLLRDSPVVGELFGKSPGAGHHGQRSGASQTSSWCSAPAVTGILRSIAVGPACSGAEQSAPPLQRPGQVVTQCPDLGGQGAPLAAS